MKIVVNNIAASSGGAMSILKNFYNYIKNDLDNKEIEWFFLLSDTYIEETSNIKIKLFPKVKKNWINRLKFDFYEGKKIIEELNPDLVISMQNTAIRGLKIPQILYVHQSIPFQENKKFSFLKKNEQKIAIYQHLIGKMIIASIKSSDYTIVQTEWMKKSILNNCNLATDRVLVFFPKLNELPPVECNYEFNHSFFYPAADLIYKNHSLIYSAVNELIKRNLNNFEVYLTIENQCTSSNIISLGTLSRNDVMRMYSESILIFPSYVETIGLPLIEASLTNSIIFAADCEYSREVLVGYENAYFFDPFDYKELANLMQKAITKKIKRKDSSMYELNKDEGWDKLITIINELV